MNIYRKIKDYVTSHYPDVIDEYSDYLADYGNDGLYKKTRAYYHLLCLLIGNKYNNDSSYQIEERDNQLLKEELISLVSCHDVLSLDIFDTTIFRNVNNPQDIYEIVGYKTGIHGFSKIRIQAEKDARDKYGEFYSLKEIYDCFSKYMCCDLEKLTRSEIDTEIEFCCINPDILEIYNFALEQKKTVIFVSDMYLETTVLKTLLQKNGINDGARIFVSCEEKKSKANGAIFERIQQVFPGKTILHIGDNYRSDYENAQKSNIDAYYYKRIESLGRSSKNGVFSNSIGCSVASAIINQSIFSGDNGNKHRKYGLIYGGPLVTGYCQWLSRMKEKLSIDKYWFLSRDTDVIFKSYALMYPQADVDYVYTSRNAVFLLTLDRYLFYYIDVLKKWKQNRVCTVGKFLNETGLNCLLSFVIDHGISEEDLLYLNFDEIIDILYVYRDYVYCSLKKMRENAKAYFRSLIGDASQIGIVDIGWRGSIFVALDYFLREICGFNVTLYCFQMGTNRQWINQELYDGGRMYSYCFSSSFNKQYDSFFSYEVARMAIVELIFSSKAPTLFSYGEEGGERGFVFGNENHGNDIIVDSMQSGILDFVDRFVRITDNKHEFSISGYDAITPLIEVTKNSKYMHSLFDDFLFSEVSENLNQNNRFGDFLNRMRY